MARRKITPEQVLDELGWLATVEHALCVDYLLLHYALRTVVETAPGVAGAVEATLSMAQNAEMHHLARVNRVLVHAGRAPVLERATHVVPASGTAVAVGALVPGRFDAFPKGEAAVAAAIDKRYARLGEVVESAGDMFDPEILGELMFLLDSVGGHAGRVDTLADELEGIDLGDLLGDVRLEPADALERDVTALSNRYYRTVVDAVAGGLAHDDALGGQLLSVAISTMDRLHSVNEVLVLRGLVPAFDLSA